MSEESSYGTAHEPDARLRLLESIVSNVGDAILVTEAWPIDKPGPKIVYANESFTRMTGYSSEEIVGKTPCILQGPGTDRARLDKIRRALTEWEPVRVELLNYRKDGTQFWVELDIVPVADEGGRITHWVSVQRDVTERRREQEAELKESEERLQTILIQYSSDMITILEPDGTIRFQSPAVADTLGYLPEEVVGDSIFDYLNPEDVEPAAGRFAEILNDPGSSQPMEVRVRHADGSWRWFEGIGSNLVDSPGVGGVVLNSRDITRRKEAEEDSRSIFENAVEGIYRTAPDGRLIAANPALAHVFGYDSSEEIVSELTNVEQNYADPEKRGEFIRLLRENGRVSGFEFQVYRKDGSVVWVADTAREVRDNEDTLLYYEGFMQDITARKEAEEQLRSAEGRYRTLVEQIPAIIYIHEPTPTYESSTYDYEVSYISPRVEEVLGYSPHEFLQNRALWNEIIHPDDLAEVLEEDERTDASGDPFSMEYRMVCRNGRVVWIREEAFLIHGAECEPLYWQGVLTDVTKQKLADKALSESEERFRTVIQVAEDVITFLDGSGNVTYVSPASERVLGYSPEELVGNNAFEYLHSDDETKVRVRFTEVLRDPQMLRAPIEFRFRHKDGFYCVLETTGTNQLSNPALGAIVMTSRDVTERKLAEKALTESERRFRSVVQNSSEVIKITDADGTLKYASPAFGRIFGYEPEEVRGTNVFDYAHPEDIPRIQEETEKALESPGADSNVVEYRFRHKNGSWLWVESIGTYLLDDPAVEGVVINVRDVTERKRDEQALQESERRFRQLFEQSVDAMYVHDEEGCFVDCNAQACRLLGYTRAELLSMSVGDISCNVLTEEERARQEDEGDTLWQRALTGEPDVLSGGHEEENIRKDGTTFPVEVRVGSVDYGGRRRLLASVRDITERKESEKELRLKDRAVSSSSNGMIITDPNQPDNPIIYVNPAFERITGYTIEETVGRNCRFLRDTDEEQSNLSELRRALDEGREWSGTLRNYRKDGETFWNELYIAPVRDGDGQLTNYIGVQKDVTERWKLERDLEYRATHDPLTGLANRRLLFARLADALEFLENTEQQGGSLCLLYIDLDGFKETNDHYGHEAGDALLAAVAGRVEGCLRPSDTAARVGGDEFCVLLEGASATEEAARVAERLVASLETPFSIFSIDTSADNLTVEISASIGIASKDKDSGSHSPDELMREADAAMYRAKETQNERDRTFYEVVELQEDTG